MATLPAKSKHHNILISFLITYYKKVTYNNNLIKSNIKVTSIKKQIQNLFSVIF